MKSGWWSSPRLTINWVPFPKFGFSVLFTQCLGPLLKAPRRAGLWLPLLKLQPVSSVIKGTSGGQLHEQGHLRWPSSTNITQDSGSEERGPAVSGWPRALLWLHRQLRAPYPEYLQALSYHPPVVQICKNHNAWWFTAGSDRSQRRRPRGHQVHERCQAPLFHYWKDKKWHFSYVGCWEPNFRNVWFLESFPPMDCTNQLKKTYNREDKPALQNNEIPAKANRKITVLITWCFRLSMRSALPFFPPEAKRLTQAHS